MTSIIFEKPRVAFAVKFMSEREKFGIEELAVVLSHYDIGVITTLKEYARGSRKAPKLLIRSEKGDYLLKRADSLGKGRLPAQTPGARQR
jgi:hypothetical protein